jgi:hypothetical protein
MFIRVIRRGRSVAVLPSSIPAPVFTVRCPPLLMPDTRDFVRYIAIDD